MNRTVMAAGAALALSALAISPAMATTATDADIAKVLKSVPTTTQYVDGPAGPDYLPVGGLFEGQQAFAYGDQQHYVYTKDGQLRHSFWSPAGGLKSDVLGFPGPYGSYVGTPTAFVSGDQQHYFARTSTGEIRHIWWGPGIGINSDSWGTDAASDPSAAILGGDQHMAYTKTDGTIEHRLFSPTSAGADREVLRFPWERAGAPTNLVGRPTFGFSFNAKMTGVNGLHLFASTRNGEMIHMLADLSAPKDVTFSSDEWVDGGVSSPPLFASYRGSDQHLFYVDPVGALAHRFWKPGMNGVRADVWAPGGLNNTMAKGSRPTGFIWGGQEHVVAKGENNSIQHRFYDPVAGRVLGDEIVGAEGRQVDDVTALVMHGQQHVFWTTSDGRVEHAFWGPGQNGPFKRDTWRS